MNLAQIIYPIARMQRVERGKSIYTRQNRDGSAWARECTEARPRFPEPSS